MAAAGARDREDAERGPRARPRREAEVVAAAARVFHERGYADASVQEVADELGILKGSLYHYIRTKEDLLFRIFQDVHRDVESILAEVASVADLDPLERIALYVQRQVLYNLANLARISVYYHELRRLGPERLALVLEWRKPHNEFLRRLIREAQEQGLADPAQDAAVVGNCIFATIIWTYRWYRPRRSPSPALVAAQCARYAVGGIALQGQTPQQEGQTP
jgi:AcrR family transcriptional regulator